MYDISDHQQSEDEIEASKYCDRQSERNTPFENPFVAEYLDHSTLLDLASRDKRSGDEL